MNEIKKKNKKHRDTVIRGDSHDYDVFGSFLNVVFSRLFTLNTSAIQ